MISPIGELTLDRFQGPAIEGNWALVLLPLGRSSSFHFHNATAKARPLRSIKVVVHLGEYRTWYLSTACESIPSCAHSLSSVSANL